MADVIDKASSRVVRHMVWGLVLLALCYAILRIGVGTVVATSRPDVALRIAPDNTEALEAASTRLIESPTVQSSRRAAELARRAYIREPVSAIGLRQLGFSAEIAGKRGKARTLLRQSELLSRRDFLGQLWLIEDAVDRNDVPTALNHYDIALRTSKRAPSILFGPMVEATTDSRLIQPLADMLVRQPPWGNFYLLQAASTSSAPRNMVRLIITLLRAGYPVTPLAIQSLTGRLLLARDYEAAWALFAAVEPAARRDGVRAPGFKGVDKDDLPFDWVFDISGSASGVVIDDAQGYRLQYRAPVGTGGVVIRQLLLLRPGTYRLSSTVLENNAGRDSAPVWRVRCADDSGDQGALSLPVVQGEPKRVQTLIKIGGCDAQWLELVLTANDDPAGIAGAVKNVSVERTSREG